MCFLSVIFLSILCNDSDITFLTFLQTEYGGMSRPIAIFLGIVLAVGGDVSMQTIIMVIKSVLGVCCEVTKTTF